MILSKRTCHVMIDSDYSKGDYSKGDLKVSLVLGLHVTVKRRHHRPGPYQTSKAATCAVTVWLIYNDLVGANSPFTKHDQ